MNDETPWVHARPGEVWILNLLDRFPVAALVANNGKFLVRDSLIPAAEIARNDDRIVNGYRIWPEGTA